MLGKHGSDLCEGGVIGQVEAQTGIVEEDEVADQSQIENTFAIEDAPHRAVQLVDDVLHSGVLEGIELERLRSSIERRNQRAAQRLKMVLTLNEIARRHSGALSWRKALMTALRTIGSLSLAARCS